MTEPMKFVIPHSMVDGSIFGHAVVISIGALPDDDQELVSAAIQEQLAMGRAFDVELLIAGHRVPLRPFVDEFERQMADTERHAREQAEKILDEKLGDLIDTLMTARDEAQGIIDAVWNRDG